MRYAFAASTMLGIALGGTAIWITAFLLYRLFLHPLSRYPGPWLAAITDWYAAFYGSRGDLHIQTLKWHREYGRVFRIGPNMVAFDDPDAYQQIYGHHANVIKTPERYAASSASHRPNSATAVHEDEFLPKRKAHVQMWTQRNLKLVEPRIQDKISTFLGIVGGRGSCTTERKDGNGWSVPQDLNKACINVAMEITSELTYSDCTNMQTSSTQRWLSDAFMVASWRGLTASMQPLLYKLHIDRLLCVPQYKQILGLGTFVAQQTRARAVREIIAKDGHADLFDSMMKVSAHTGGRAFDKKDMWLEAYLMVGVGTSTSGPTLANIFFYLLYYPQAYDKAVAEIRARFASEEDIVLGPRLNSCKYLFACIDETLRLCPVLANILARTVQPGGMAVGREVLPAGTGVGTSIYVLHRNEALFPDAHLFKPERFLTEDANGNQVIPRGYVPYSTGPRTCPGWRLAVVEASLTVGRTLFSYDVRLAGAVRGQGTESRGKGTPERRFRSWIGLKVDGPVAQFRRRCS